MSVSVIEAYLDFVLSYAPYFYVDSSGEPDLDWGKGVAPAAHAIDFLYEIYNDSRFDERKSEVFGKIVSLADFLVSLQCTEESSLAYGGFKSTESSNYYYSIDAMRAIPSLLKAYSVTKNQTYFDSAMFAAEVFLYNMQHKPSELGQHDKYYGGFAEAVTFEGAWLPEMRILHLYGLIGLKMLFEQAKNPKFQEMINDALNFYRGAFESLWLKFSPLPSGDGRWHRLGTSENLVYDDDFAYALNGIYFYEGFSKTVSRVYDFLNSMPPSSEYPAYNPAICWAGYIDVEKRGAACNYYDAVTSGILWQMRKNHDKLSFDFSTKIIKDHWQEFMFWGPKFEDYTPIEEKKSVVTVSWLGILLLKYVPPQTPFIRTLNAYGEEITLYPVREAKDDVYYGEGIRIKALVQPSRIEEIILEPGYTINDYITIHVFVPIKPRDKIERKGLQYEVSTVQDVYFRGELVYKTAVCRRLVGA